MKTFSLYFPLFLFQCISPVYSLTPPDINLRAVDSTPDYDILSYTPAESSGLIWYQQSGSIPSTGRPYVAHVALFEPSFFSFRPPTEEGCTEYIKTSESSSGVCEYATNGGFFTWDDTVACKCVGNLVSDGVEYILDGMGNANFGLTYDNKVVTGFIDDDSYKQLNFTYLMSGSGWLVRNGVSYIASSPDVDIEGNFVLEKAPRTSVGIFSNGTMVLYEVDGEEDIEAGPDLFEMAELLELLGVQSAVNIDGGGSSVSVYDGKVISQPTCDDTSTICEREVQSITCVRK